ncbi:MAG: MBOAT family O-acyltransferase [Aggregatilineales bacterium]
MTSLLSRTSVPWKKKIYLSISVIVNIGLLFYFKYLFFFADSANQILSFIGTDGRLNTPAILLPVGISFYTFQTLGYTIDVYRGKIEREKNPVVFALFVSFFPQLVAGPIERSADLLPQLRNIAHKKLWNASDISDGLRLITWGMFKKIVVADRLAMYVNPIYNEPETFRGMSLILATVFFAFQIYCDFSGYSDIAIGVARLFGVRLSKNFDAPYFARSLPDFWQRWHITLSKWFRDYLYIPLGGNRVSEMRWGFNIIIVFAVSGIWHGANWTFAIWGLLHGGMYLASHYLSKMKSPFMYIPRWMQIPIQTFLVFVCVCVAWIFFRANTVHDAFLIIGNMFAFGDGWAYRWDAINVVSGELTIALGLFGILTVLLVDGLLKWITPDVRSSAKLAPMRLAFYTLLVFSLTLFGIQGPAQQFVYFQF